MNKEISMPPSTFGLWRITTEGDCEGRTVRDLGVHEGHFDELALKFGSKAYYGLRFEWINPNDHTVSELVPAAKVQVSFDIKTGTWDQTPEQRAVTIERWLRANGRSKVTVRPGQYYACVELIDEQDPEEIERKRKKAIAMGALAKLSQEEREALGY